jgi:zinc transport system substrate-binding protein
MKVVNIAKDIDKSAMSNHSHDNHKHHGDDDENLDPHIWTSPSNVKIIAKNIYKALKEIDKANENYYKQNYAKFLKHIEQTDKKIKLILKNSEHAKFMVFHPAWGYFAKEYHLEQLAIESGGKSPKPKHLTYLIDEAKEKKVKAIFTSPEFSQSSAKLIAKAVGVPVVKISPLNPKWSQNIIKLAKAIANK